MQGLSMLTLSGIGNRLSTFVDTLVSVKSHTFQGGSADGNCLLAYAA